MLPAPVTRPQDAPSRLLEVGLPTIEVLYSAVMAGLTAYLNCPRLAPLTGPGQLMHIETVAALRAQIEPQDWIFECDRNQEPSLSPNRRVRLVVMSGDEGTGIEAETPLSRHPRGPLGVRNVMRNQLTLDLFPGANISPGVLPDRRLTWSLVHFVDKFSREVRTEVSMPRDLGADNRVDGWHERILLEPLPFDGVGIRRIPSSGAGTDDAVDVPVARRHA